jgi:NhaP-type Na+/H+ and K+/H+ antiporter
VYLDIWQPDPDTIKQTNGDPPLAGYSGNGLLAAAVRRNERLIPFGDATQLKEGDQVYFLVFETEQKLAGEFLEKAGWQRIGQADREAFSTSTCTLEP